MRPSVGVGHETRPAAKSTGSYVRRRCRQTSKIAFPRGHGRPRGRRKPAEAPPIPFVRWRCKQGQGFEASRAFLTCHEAEGEFARVLSIVKATGRLPKPEEMVPHAG